MRTLKQLGVLAVVVFALSATGTANASVDTFTASATGNVFGKALETQTFTVNGGQITCATAETFGPIEKTASTEQHLTVAYRGCTAFSLANVDISPATYLITASGQVHLLNTVTINVTSASCSISMGPQTVGSFSFSNNAGKLKLTPNVTGITYTSTGGTCGASGSNGTFTGKSELERMGGGTLAFDAGVVYPPSPTGSFTYSATGSLTGKATATQTFTINGGQIKCTVAETSGTIVTLPPLKEQHLTTNYKGCTAFGFATVHVSSATYKLTASGAMDLTNSVTVTVTAAGCDVTFGPQTLKPISFTNNGGRLSMIPNVTGITYTTTGGLCGSSGSNGTFTGTSEIERVGGGTFTYDP
ncbi:MAG TPA: hypothetical protein VJU14_03820 [Solirubrobacterales bacterium]|nr:hypothetical protein [Solirubrobacterales bacterium]